MLIFDVKNGPKLDSIYQWKNGNLFKNADWTK